MNEGAGRLVDKDGKDVQIGASVTSGDGVFFVLMGWRRPHKVSSTGRVFVQRKGDKFDRSYFPHVFGLKIVDHGFVDAPEPTVVEDAQGNVIGEDFGPITGPDLDDC